jgi:hypothetical protein
MKSMLRRLYRNLVKPMLHNPPGQVLESARVRKRGTLRQKEQYGMLEWPNYAYGLLRAADQAKFLGKRRATVCEFGVATGGGLMNMVELSEMITADTGVSFRIVGLDTGEGLPVIEGYKDHPELWSVGDFAMIDREAMKAKFRGRAELIFGDIKDTVHDLVESFDPDAPLGFISVDVDIYSGARSALACLLGRPELYSPGISIYFDDVQFFYANRWCGELFAIDEFNEANDLRKIDRDRSLPGLRPKPYDRWYNSMYVCHVLDHEVRNHPRERDSLSAKDHYAFMMEASLF